MTMTMANAIIFIINGKCSNLYLYDLRAPTNGSVLEICNLADNDFRFHTYQAMIGINSSNKNNKPGFAKIIISKFCYTQYDSIIQKISPTKLDKHYSAGFVCCGVFESDGSSTGDVFSITCSAISTQCIHSPSDG